MPLDAERKDIQKSMACDLLKIFRSGPNKTYTPDEIEKLIDACIDGAKQ